VKAGGSELRAGGKRVDTLAVIEPEGCMWISVIFSKYYKILNNRSKPNIRPNIR
jgi:hypothetical protein